MLSDLARDSDTALAPLARERAHARFIEHSSTVAEATAERGDDLEADIERLPRFLQELRPTMRRLGGLSDEATPVFADLGDAAPDINRMIHRARPVLEAGIPAVESLGDASEIGTPAMRDALPVTKDLRRFAKVRSRSAATAAAVLESFKQGRGVERLLDYVFYQVAAVNGFDSFGHYLRARLILNTCSRYYTAPVDGCSARFASSAAQTSSASAASAADSDPILRRTLAALQGKDPDSVAPLPESMKPKTPRSSRRRSKRTAKAERRPSAPAARRPSPRRRPRRPPARAAAPGNVNQGEAVLDYLFGKDAG